jgi:2-dehydro-3-deoxy-D-arabinonate dehydratase
MLELFHLDQAVAVRLDDTYYRLETEWDALINRDDLAASLRDELLTRSVPIPRPLDADLFAPVGSQEVWAAGVTYFRSRNARMEEAKQAGGGDFYDRVYTAERPELFFKANARAVIGPGKCVRIRRDSQWNVPEPELALVINSRGAIVGYTIGNDMSSRDIEGENPLYLPQAKVYDKSCALGPGVLVAEKSLPRETEIRLEIRRAGETCVSERTSLAAMKRSPEELVAFLFREHGYPHGCVLLTGTGIVPPDSFTLATGDEIRITIDPIGTLINRVE